MLKCHQNSNAALKVPFNAALTEGAKSVLTLITEIGISDNAIILIHHHRRGQASTEKLAALQQWQNKLETKIVGWSSGEAANKTANKKGYVEVRIINRGSKMNDTEKQPGMSRGFELSVKTIVAIASSFKG